MTRQKLGDLIQGIIEAQKEIEILEKDFNEGWDKEPDRFDTELNMSRKDIYKEKIKKAVEQLNLIKI